MGWGQGSRIAPGPAAVGIVTACRHSDPGEGSVGRTLGQRAQESYSPTAPRQTLAASMASPSADSTSGDRETFSNSTSRERP